jgi:hypothetical protein
MVNTVRAVIFIAETAAGRDYGQIDGQIPSGNETIFHPWPSSLGGGSNSGLKHFRFTLITPEKE